MSGKLVDLSKFLDRNVEVVTNDFCVRGILRKVESGSEHDSYARAILRRRFRTLLPWLILAMKLI
jgi:hypothetical protein